MSDFPDVMYYAPLDNMLKLHSLTMFDIQDGGMVAHVKNSFSLFTATAVLKDGIWWLHNEHGPAYVNTSINRDGSGHLLFFIDGHNSKIEDLLIDQEVKLMFLLKYTYKKTCHNGYYWYD